MDYLPAERSRGITITSACITFPWHTHTINLIDTPGHADFTFEVERAIRVLDGAVTILDGVAGVEAQTEKVWRQAHRYGIPRVIYINKLDRVGAGFGRTVREVGIKLGGWPAVCQIPLYEAETESEEVFVGVVDIVEKRVFRWGEKAKDGRNVTVLDYKWLEENRPELYQEALKARVALVELLTEFDSDLVEHFLELGDHHLIAATDIKKALRTQILDGKGRIIPIFCGASFRNVGVQPLLDGVVDYLPSPEDRPPVEVSWDAGKERGALEVLPTRVCALAFKVIQDPRKGMMVFVRVYSGTLTRAAHLLNTNLGTKERAQRLLRMYADEAVDISEIPTGHIGVILGLKHARTGDTLISEPPKPASTHQPSNRKKHSKRAPLLKRDPATLQLKPIIVPPPVFFASLEPTSLSEQKPLEEALAILLREDPSLHVSIDPDSGQTLLAGMGELHLEIARDRLVGDLKAKAEMGRILIGYRETVTGPLGPPVHKVYDRDVAGKRVIAAITASVGEGGEELNAEYSRHSRDIDSVIALDSANTLTVTILTLNLPPSPTNPTTEPRACRALSRASLPSGRTSAITSEMPTAAAMAWAEEARSPVSR